MRKLRLPVALFTCCALVASAVFAIAAEEISLKDVKCLLVAKKDANKEKASKWKDGKVFFCCDGCRGKFEKMDDEKKEEIAPKANFQLVATKQYEQGACPISGRDVNKEKNIKVDGVTVAFCCDGCKSKAEKMKEDKRVAALFGEKAFEKAKYKPVKHEK